MIDEPFTYRPPITEAMKQKIRDVFAVVPEGKRGALVALVDEHGARLHLAHKINDHWTVGGAVGKPWGERVEGSVAIEGTW